MIETNNFNVISKEVLTVLAYCDNSILKKIPNKLIKELSNYAADTEKKCYIDTNKELAQQDILEESKDLIALIYYSYVLDEDNKKKTKETWDLNEIKHQKEMKKTYNIENLFKERKINNNKNMSLIKYKEENYFIKVIKKILAFCKKM